MTSIADNNPPSEGIPGEESLPGELHTGRKRTVDFGQDTAALLAAIPGMLGFIPEHSMVLLGLSSPQRRSLGSTTSKVSEVGPVVRTELETDAVQTAVDVVGQALRRSERKEVLIVVIGGDATVLVAEACQRFRHENIHVSAAFVVAEMRVGAPWWEISVGVEEPEVGEGSRVWAGGALPDPRRSRVLQGNSRQFGPQRVELMEQQSFGELLDVVPVPESVAHKLPESWREGPSWERTGESLEMVRAGSQRDRTTVHQVPHVVPPRCQEVLDVCALVNLIRSSAEKSSPPASSAILVIDLLQQAEQASYIAHVCDSVGHYPILVALAAGPAGTAVTTLLMGTAQVARGPLRQRALTLLAIVSWCNTRGVMAHRATHRALAEIRRSSRQRWVMGEKGDTRSSIERMELTVRMAGNILSAIELGETPREVRNILDKGISFIEDAWNVVATGSGDSVEQVRDLLGQVMDRDSVDLMRSELESRAEK